MSSADPQRLFFSSRSRKCDQDFDELASRLILRTAWSIPSRPYEESAYWLELLVESGLLAVFVVDADEKELLTPLEK